MPLRATACRVVSYERTAPNRTANRSTMLHPVQDEEWLADRLIKTGAMRDRTAGERVVAELWPERLGDRQVPQPIRRPLCRCLAPSDECHKRQTR